MKAAVFKGDARFAIEERPIPEPQANEVLVKIMAVGICGSDVHGFAGLSGKRRLPGLVMGHEAAGIVEACGSGVNGWKKGDRVAIDPQKTCGACQACRRGWSNLCENMLCIGSSMRKFADGAMQEYLCLLPTQLIKLPDKLSYAEGTFVDPLCNVMHVLDRSGAKLGDTIAIIGAGVMGLLAVQFARLKGAGKIIAVDCIESRLALAQKLGADIVINSAKEDTVETIMRATDGVGADVVMEAVGMGVTYNNAILCARKRGVVAALGFRDDVIPVPAQPFLFREITLIGCTGFTYETQRALGMVSKDMVDVKELITHTFKLEDTQKAFETLHNHPAEAIKVILSME